MKLKIFLFCEENYLKFTIFVGVATASIQHSFYGTDSRQRYATEHGEIVLLCVLLAIFETFIQKSAFGKYYDPITTARPVFPLQMRF